VQSAIFAATNLNLFTDVPNRKLVILELAKSALLATLLVRFTSKNYKSTLFGSLTTWKID
jgi:hypothetical protein